MQKLMYIVAYDYLDDTHTEQVCATESIAEAIAEFNDTCSMVQDDIKAGSNYTDYVSLYSATCEVDDDGYIDELIVIEEDIKQNDYTAFTAKLPA